MVVKIRLGLSLDLLVQLFSVGSCVFLSFVNEFVYDMASISNLSQWKEKIYIDDMVVNKF